MSRRDYLNSQELSKNSKSFASLIMAALRRADSTNAKLLRTAWPEICDELQERYNTPGGYTKKELEEED
jgi:hypothetical protein